MGQGSPVFLLMFSYRANAGILADTGQYVITKPGSSELAAVVVCRYSQWAPQHILGSFGLMYQ